MFKYLSIDLLYILFSKFLLHNQYYVNHCVLKRSPAGIGTNF